ncbi:MAG TPA: hypothetical protein VHS56_01490 [Candidatus Cybelea sp.]|nr:hypothetical protein [Candidatus Cybelea sp.]
MRASIAYHERMTGVQTISLKKVTVLGFAAPAIIMLGAFISVVLGRGQAIMLPSTLASLTFYGVMIAVGAAWRDGSPGLFRWTRRAGSFVLGGIVLAILLSAAGCFSVALGGSELLWRPLLTMLACVCCGIGLASVIPPRVSG